MSKSLHSGFLIAMPVVVALACATERVVDLKQPPSLGTATPTACVWPNPPGWYTGPIASNKEEEVLGAITSANTAWEVSLTVRDQDTQNNQASYFTSAEPVNFLQPCSSGGHNNANAEWGWYGFGTSFSPQCDVIADQQTNEPEHHRSPNAAFTQEYERHCVNAGRFIVTLENDGSVAFVRPIDFIAYVPIAGMQVEDTSQLREVHPALGNATNDVFVDVSETDLPNATLGIAVSAARNAYDPAWNTLQPGTYHVPSNFWVRLRSTGSVPGEGVPLNRLLVRYFWNYTVDPNDRSGFSNSADLDLPLIRVHKFAQGSRTVRMHLVQPDERPADPADVAATNYGLSSDLLFDVYAPLDVSIAPNPASVIVLQPLQLSDAGGNGAGSSYQWDFGDGTPQDTVASPTHTYTTPGLKVVSLDKTDPYFTVSGTRNVTVTDPPPTALTASNVGTTSATIGWTIGNVAATTTIQHRVTGTSTWVAGGTAAPGVSNLALTSLASCTTYDVNAYHVIAATTALNLFRTTGGGIACAPLSFTLQSCTDETVGENVYRTYNVVWTQGEFSSGSTYEIGQTNNSDPAGALIMKSGPSYKTGAAIGPYLRSKSQLLYFWVRHKLSGGAGPSAWVALDTQPVNPNGGCF